MQEPESGNPGSGRAGGYNKEMVSKPDEELGTVSGTGTTSQPEPAALPIDQHAPSYSNTC